ncbi:MAG TPA: hypothetical protein VFX13_13835 [Gaiellales bacterium]|nr:hypothetical protein [Gaiellales bacterium]
MRDSLADRRWRPRWLHMPNFRRRWDSMLDHQWIRPRWMVIPSFRRVRMSDRPLPSHMLVPGIAIVALLFGGGLYFGNMLGSDPSAAGTGFITTVTRKGTVVTLKGKRVRVVVPPKTITRHGKTIHVPRKTVDLTHTQTRTQTRTQQVPVPTTITQTRTVTRTVTSTVTVTSVSVPPT